MVLAAVAAVMVVHGGGASRNGIGAGASDGTGAIGADSDNSDSTGASKLVVVKQ